MPSSLHDLACDIANNGRLEEFHQKHHNFTMYDYHKAVRQRLEREYHERRNQGERLQLCVRVFA